MQSEGKTSIAENAQEDLVEFQYPSPPPPFPFRWQLRGRVIHGHGRGGSQLGCPTANVDLSTCHNNKSSESDKCEIVGSDCNYNIKKCQNDNSACKKNCESNELKDLLSPFHGLVMYGWGCIEPSTECELHNDASKEQRKEECCNTDHVCQSKQWGPFPVAVSVGTNVHFNDQQLSVEAHFINYTGYDFYGSIIRIYILGTIHNEMCCKDLYELKCLIHTDIQYAIKQLETTDEFSALQFDRFVQPNTILTKDETSALPFFRMIKNASNEERDIKRLYESQQEYFQ